MAVEIVVLVPLLLMVMVLIVAMGRLVSAEGDAESAAREAVRAATFERNPTDAASEAQRAATATLPATLTCGPVDLGGAFVSGANLTVALTCEVSWQDLGLIGLPGTTQVTATSSAPLDVYRRTGP